MDDALRRDDVDDGLGAAECVAEVDDAEGRVLPRRHNLRQDNKQNGIRRKLKGLTLTCGVDYGSTAKQTLPARSLNQSRYR